MLMFMHVSLGGLSLVSGAFALMAKKGSYWHRVAGRIFLTSMVLMSLAGSVIAYLKPEMITLLGGLFTSYLVMTAWLVIQPAGRMQTTLTSLLCVLAMLIGIAGMYNGWLASTSETGLKDGFPKAPYFFFGTLALVCACFDFKLLLQGPLIGMHRISRHMWRMCFAMFMATASFFDGPGAKTFPEALHGSAWLLVPQVVVLLILFFWLIRVYYFKRIS